MPHLRSKSAGNYESSWEPGMAKRILEMVQAKQAAADPAMEGDDLVNPLVMVALVGVPGCGSTVSAMLLANLLEQQGCDTMALPVDGYHYPIESLKTFPDAEDAIYRRGAPDTFDPHALLRDLRRIDGTCDTISIYSNPDSTMGEESNIVSLPGFDHAKGDPVSEAHTFDRNRHKVVIVDGMYLLHNQDGWEEIASVFDLKIFMDSDMEECMEKIRMRNQVIPGYTPEEIDVRTEQVDRVHADIVLQTKSRADVVVESFVNPLAAAMSEEPPEPSEQALALNQLTLTNVEYEEAIDEDARDWQMDIGFRDFTPLSRSNSLISVRDDSSHRENEHAPPPASQFVGSWEPEQAQIILEAIRQRETGSNAAGARQPFMIALIGTPGSGKSVSSFMLASQLEDAGYPTMVCPHDGYHYPLEYLKTFPEADDFIYRRGAPDTFDPRALLRDLGRIRDGDEVVIKLPAFDHARADPEPDTHIFDRHIHKIVLCEGLYLLHDQDGWEEIATMFDYSIFMNSDLEVCIERVKVRNQCIPGYSPEEIEERCEKVDRVNSLTVMRSKVRATVIVDTIATKK